MKEFKQLLLDTGMALYFRNHNSICTKLLEGLGKLRSHLISSFLECEQNPLFHKQFISYLETLIYRSDNVCSQNFLKIYTTRLLSFK